MSDMHWGKHNVSNAFNSTDIFAVCHGGSIWSMIDIKVCLRVLSHLVCLPGPNPSSIAPSSPCPRWTAIILFYFGPNRSSFASSSQQLFTPLLSNDGAGEGGKMNNIALCTFIYLRFWTVRFVYKASVHKALTSVLWMYCKCSKERWKRTEMRHTAFCLQRVSHAHQESEWNTHKPIFLSNKTALLQRFTSVIWYDCVHISSEPYRSSLEPYPRPPFLSRLWYGSWVCNRVRKTAFTSSKRTELWCQSNPGAHQKC